MTSVTVLAGEAVLFALLAGVLFAVANIFTRIGVNVTDPIYGTAISTLTGTGLLFITLILLNGLSALLTMRIFGINVTKT